MNARYLIAMGITGIGLGCVMVAVRADQATTRKAEQANDAKSVVPPLTELEKKLAEVLEERVVSATRSLEATRAAYDAQTVTLDQMTDAMRALTDAKLAVAKTPQQRVEILQQNVEMHRQLEKQTYVLYQTGTRGGEAARHARAKTALLTAEIQLLRERLKDES